MASDTPPQDSRPPYVREGKDGTWFLQVRVQPGAKKSEVAGTLDDRLKIRLSAPPVDNKANGALIEFIAKKLAIRQSKVTLTAGATSRQKNLAISTDTEPNWQLLL